LTQKSNKKSQERNGLLTAFYFKAFANLLRRFQPVSFFHPDWALALL